MTPPIVLKFLFRVITLIIQEIHFQKTKVFCIKWKLFSVHLSCSPLELLQKIAAILIAVLMQIHPTKLRNFVRRFFARNSGASENVENA